MVRLIVFVIVILSSVQVFAQIGGPPMRIGCWVDTTRTCALMAVWDPLLPPFLPCVASACELKFGVLKCPKGEGLTVTDPDRAFHDIDLVAGGQLGRTGTNWLIEPWSCGDVFACSCVGRAVGLTCVNGDFLRGYQPIQYSTVGPIDCFGTGGGNWVPWP